MKIIFSRIRNRAANQMSSSKEQGVGLFASLAKTVSGPGEEIDEDEVKGRVTPPHEAGFSYVPIGAGTAAGKGVYYLVIKKMLQYLLFQFVIFFVVNS